MLDQKPDHQRPELPAFWDKRFSESVTPWSAGGVPPELANYIDRLPAPPRRVLIPGCGHAWEAGWLAAGGAQVTALDFSPAALTAAAQTLGDWPGELLCADFFQFAPPEKFDLIYERAFLCAMPRRRWRDYGARMRDLLAPGGALIGFFFFDDAPKGPPFGISASELAAILQPAFVCTEDRAVAQSLPAFAGRERWQVWRRGDAEEM